jgi:DNA-binding MarR family transcriptional regulator
MSISLDVALYLREQCQGKNITLADRGVLLTLMFRVGSNPFTWISQNELAKELDCSESTLRRHLKNLVKSGLILIDRDKKNKSCNCYRPSPHLINYHQNNRNEQKNHQSELNGSNGKHRSNMTGDFINTGHICTVHTGQKRPVFNCTNCIQPIELNEEKQYDILPKEKEERKNKRKYIKPLPLLTEKMVLPFWLRDEDWNDFLENRKLMKSPMSFIAQKKAITQLKKMHDEGEDVKEVINQSIINNWKGFFPVRQGISYAYKQLSYTEKLKRAGNKLDQINASKGMGSKNIHEIESDIPF